jgi:hypothetical protein
LNLPKQLCFDDVEAGTEIKPLEKIATTLMLVQWAGASGDFNPLHYEEDFARNLGVGQPIVHGALKRAWLVNMLTDWIGDEAKLKQLSCRYKGMDYPRKMKTLEEPLDGETWWCKGHVLKKYLKGAECLVECEIWVENGKGERTTQGKAVVSLPRR